MSKPLPPRSSNSVDRHSKRTRALRSKRETRLCENPAPASLSASASCQRGSSCNTRKSVQFGSHIPLQEFLRRRLRKSSRRLSLNGRKRALCPRRASARAHHQVKLGKASAGGIRLRFFVLRDEDRANPLHSGSLGRTKFLHELPASRGQVHAFDARGNLDGMKGENRSAVRSKANHPLFGFQPGDFLSRPSLHRGKKEFAAAPGKAPAIRFTTRGKCSLA